MFDASAYEIVMIVHELHLRGYEQLRLFSGISPNGMCWRWAIYPKVLMKDSNECELYDFLPFECPYGSTGSAFPSNDQEVKTVDDFLREYESYVNLAKGEDNAYVEWFKQIVEHAKNYDFPIAYSEFFHAKQWKFGSSEDLERPPFSPVTLESLNDEQMIDLARCVFDDWSISNLNEIMNCKGNKSTIHDIAEVIRTALNEKKCLFCHYDDDEDITELFAEEDEYSDKIRW